MLRLLLVVAVFVWSSPGSAQSDQEVAREQLKQLQSEITRINSEINSASTRRSTLQKQLREAEVALGKLQRDIARNRKAMSATRQELEELEGERAATLKVLDRQAARIATELRAAWQMGRQGQIRVLLNQEDPDTVARAMAYYRYFFEARNELLGDYRATLNRLADLEDGIARTLEELREREQAMDKQQTRLKRARQTREEAVVSLSSSIRSKGEQLKQKEQDRKELEELLKAIEEAVVNLQVPDNYQAFRQARGKMPWPLKGEPGNRFGRPRNEGKMRWQGVNIPAAEGTTVRAIHHGRVVYSDWLRGSGLLLIIDHGDGYMSLYAHNQSLLREVGEWVTAGTPIATVGSSGGLERSALYFEIRHKGKPTDPARWCKG
jgi:septal ring factor EnvC (AmiA/AmiB activator)